MATKNGYRQVKDLIKEGSLSEEQSYKQGFLTKSGKAGWFEIELYNNRLLFMAQCFGHALPFIKFRINRKTTLLELFEIIETWA